MYVISEKPCSAAGTTTVPAHVGPCARPCGRPGTRRAAARFHRVAPAARSTVPVRRCAHRAASPQLRADPAAPGTLRQPCSTQIRYVGRHRPGRHPGRYRSGPTAPAPSRPGRRQLRPGRARALRLPRFRWARRVASEDHSESLGLAITGWPDDDHRVPLRDHRSELSRILWRHSVVVQRPFAMTSPMRTSAGPGIEVASASF
jgi:hypothetical protein